MRITQRARTIPALPDMTLIRRAIVCGPFSVSVWQVLTRTMSREEVISRGTLLKEKLGSRAHGLNSN